MSARLPRRGFLGLAALGGAGCLLAACAEDGNGTQDPDDNTTTTGAPQLDLPAIVTDEDLVGWFDDPGAVAALGAGAIGQHLLGSCGIATPSGGTTAEAVRAAIATERACGSLVQLGGWFVTPTEAAIARSVAAQWSAR